MNWTLSQRPRSVLGLHLAGDRLSLCHLARANGGAEVRATSTVALPADFLRQDAVAVGRQLREQLAQAGCRERRCVVSLPARWVLARNLAAPELSPEDLAAYLQLEAEKNFPVDPAHLQLAASTCRIGLATHLTQLAVRREQLDALSAILAAAGLKPVSYTLGLAALPGAIPAGPGRLTASFAPDGATLLVAAGGGIAGWRTVDPAGALGREFRITLEQLPSDLRDSVRELQLGGDEAAVRAAEPALAGWAQAAGLTLAPRSAGRPWGEQMAEAVGRRWLSGDRSSLEFLPPRPGRFAAWWPQHRSRRLNLAGGVAGAVLLLALLAFGWREYLRWSLGSEWSALKTPVTELTALQALVQEYRPWCDTSFHSLSILRGVTAAFPESGSVTAKSFELRGTSAVTLGGTARDNAALLQVLDQLRKTAEVQDLKVEQIRGRAPLQFTLSFHWKEAIR